MKPVWYESQLQLRVGCPVVMKSWPVRAISCAAAIHAAASGLPCNKHWQTTEKRERRVRSEAEQEAYAMMPPMNRVMNKFQPLAKRLVTNTKSGLKRE